MCLKHNTSYPFIQTLFVWCIHCSFWVDFSQLLKRDQTFVAGWICVHKTASVWYCCLQFHRGKVGDFLSVWRVATLYTVLYIVVHRVHEHFTCTETLAYVWKSVRRIWPRWAWFAGVAALIAILVVAWYQWRKRQARRREVEQLMEKIIGELDSAALLGKLQIGKLGLVNE